MTGDLPRRALIVHSGGVHVLAAARSLHAPERDPDGFVAAVAALVAEHGYDVVFGADDIEVLLLSARRDEIGCVVPYAAHADVVRAIDKLALVEAAGRVGLAVPQTEVATAAALAAVDGPGGGQGPAALGPRRRRQRPAPDGARLCGA